VTRSRIMRRVKSQDTRPEMLVRRVLHNLGFRYRLHRKDLPGSPDIVFGSRKLAVFVNGCFWHGHSCARGNRLPATNTPYWRRKISTNRKRDARNRRRLNRLGWSVITVWECRIEQGIARIVSVLEYGHSGGPPHPLP